MHATISTWADQIELVNNVPFLYLILTDSTTEELRDIVHALNQKRAGFYMAVSEMADAKSTFVVTLDAQYTSTINLQKFGAWLKDEYALKGGVNKNTIQGGGGKIDPNLGAAIKQWIVRK